MSNSFNLSFLSPALRQALIQKMQNLSPEDDVTEKEIEKIAADIAKSENNTDGNKKLNMNRILKAMEFGISLNAEKLNNITSAKGISNAEIVYPLNTDFLYSLLKMGIIALDNENHLIKDDSGLPKIVDTDAASKLVGEQVNSFMELYKAVGKNSFSYEEDISPHISEDYLNELLSYNWLIGPLEEYATEEDFDNENITGRRYALNRGKIEQDFATYLAGGNKIETIEDLVKALDWATENNHNVNGKIDEGVFQGGTGDCWLISSILALNATEAGKQILNDAMQVNADGSVTVTFKGIKTADGKPVQYTITAEEIRKHDTDYNSYDAFSNGDNDMLVMELAVEKLEKDIYDQNHRGRNSLGKEILLPNIPEIADTQPGENIYDENGDIIGRDYIEGGFSERLLYFLTGNGSQVIYPEGYANTADELMKKGNGSYIDPILGTSDGVAFSGLSQEQINALFESMEENPKALTFGLYPDPDTFDKNPDGSYAVYDLGDGDFCLATTRQFTDVNGKKFTLKLPFTHIVFNDDGTPKLDANGNLQYTKASAADAYIGHALVITGVDTEKRTVTITNPYDSTDEYTFTWEQFQKMGILSMTATDIGSNSSEQPSVTTTDVDSPEQGNTRNVNNTESTNRFKFATLEEAIEKMGLRKTYCNGVYCEQHNPNKPAGDYSEQRHYVWNEATHEMIELKGVFYISSNGQQAKGLDGYEEVLAYQQGYKFTDEKGIYEKDGKIYSFDNKTLSFVETQEAKTRGMENNNRNTNSSGEPDIVKYLNSPEFASYMQNLSSWCSQNNCSMQVIGFDDVEFVIEIYSKVNNKYGGQIVIDSDGNVQFDPNYSEVSISLPPLPQKTF